ncbi:hypothetical protein SAMN05421820_103385 [Pedobacter steynii]|uniref:Uncharacterized protein n=1 Tax=Pedobacter steynii TaxID=430522 RepID=A0A1G9RWC2_9SPHI|nr:hypothetical protein SAMN05421820_103385 [Pedobacter steynii]
MNQKTTKTFICAYSVQGFQLAPQFLFQKLPTLNAETVSVIFIERQGDMNCPGILY